MKRFLTFVPLLLLSFWVTAQNKLFSPLGKAANFPVECSCIDPKGILTVGYYVPGISDTLFFESFNPVFKIWKKAGRVQALKTAYGMVPVKCTYLEDSLIVFSTYKKGGSLHSGIFQVMPFGNRAMGELKFGPSQGYVTDLKVIDKHLFLFGQFDTILLGQNQRKKARHVAYWDSDKWEDVNSILDNKTNLLNDIPVALRNDTAMMVAGDRSVYQFVYPDRWNKVMDAPGDRKFTSAITYRNFWVFTMANSDSILFYNGKSFTYKKFNHKLGPSVTLAAVNNGLMVSDAGNSGRLLWMDGLQPNLIPVYQAFRNDTLPRHLLSDKNSIYFFTSTPVLYRNVWAGTRVQINTSECTPFTLDTISLFVFNDVNWNFRKDAGEGYIFPSRVFNRTYQRELISTTGIFKDLVPSYNDVEYAYLSNNNCFSVPFTGLLKSRNTYKNIVHDSLFFPLHSVNLAKDLSIKSWGKACVRLMDTATLEVNIFNKDCLNNPTDATVTVTLDKNTLLLGTTPPYSSKAGNQVVFQMKNLDPVGSNLIKLNVVYPFGVYQAGQYVKHFARISTTFAENTSNNYDSICQKLVYSYDPNSKNSIPQGRISSDLNTIRYFIDFQNEGNDDARRVVIVDTLDVSIPVYEFQMISSSHPYTVSLKNNVVTWVFDNINLPPKSVSESGSKGYIIFEAHLSTGIKTGDSIQNKAYIYFDYNEPVITNIAMISRFDDPVLPPDDVTGKYSILVYPNPSGTNITIENKSAGTQEVEVFDLIGQKILDISIEGKEKLSETVSEWPQGIYLVRSSKGGFQRLLVH